MHSEYMAFKPNSAATLPRRLPSQIQNTTEDKILRNNASRSPPLSPASHRKEFLESKPSEYIKKDLISPPSRRRTLQPASSYLKDYTKSETSSKSPSRYPSALSTKWNDKNNSTLAEIGYKPSHLSLSSQSSSVRNYNSLPRKVNYSSRNTANTTILSSSSSSSSYSYQRPERGASIQPNYKRISPHSMGSYYSPSSTSVTHLSAGSPSCHRKYLSRAEVASERPSSRPW